MRPLASLLNDRAYKSLVRKLRSKANPQQVASIRRRGFIGALTRWWQETCHGRSIHGAEIGVKYGGFSSDVLTHCPFIESLYCIDPWAEYPEDHPDRLRFGYAGRDQPSWDWLYKRACEILGKHGDRAKVWRATSSFASGALQVRRELLDFAYIDAAHDYASVLWDCQIWWAVVRPGGLLSGDDYYPVGQWRRDTTGVSHAVDDFAASMGLPVVSHHRSWFIEKPR